MLIIKTYLTLVVSIAGSIIAMTVGRYFLAEPRVMISLRNRHWRNHIQLRCSQENKVQSSESQSTEQGTGSVEGDKWWLILAEHLPYAFSLMVLILIMVLSAALYVAAAAYEYVT